STSVADVITAISTGVAVATTDATATTLFTVILSDEKTYYIRAVVVARRTGGSAGDAGDSAAYVVSGCFKRTGGGAATLVGAVQADFAADDQAGWNCTLDTDTNNVRIRVTGAVDNN